MKAIKILLVVISFGAMLSSCAVSGPLFVTDNPSVKEGRATMTVWFGFIRPINADISIRTAAKNGGITKIATVDQKISNAKLFRVEYTTIVTGE